MNIKWKWYAPRNANKITVRMKDFTEYDIFTGLTKDKKLGYLRIFRYNPKGYKTTQVFYKIYDNLGEAMFYGHRMIKNLISKGGKVT